MGIVSRIINNMDKQPFKVIFNNTAPEDKEWTAHINLLNNWTEPDRYLRHIIQYARLGKHYPADMHVDLIKQVINSALPTIPPKSEHWKFNNEGAGVINTVLEVRKLLEIESKDEYNSTI